MSAMPCTADSGANTSSRCMEIGFSTRHVNSTRPTQKNKWRRHGTVPNRRWPSHCHKPLAAPASGGDQDDVQRAAGGEVGGLVVQRRVPAHGGAAGKPEDGGAEQRAEDKGAQQRRPADHAAKYNSRPQR